MRPSLGRTRSIRYLIVLNAFARKEHGIVVASDTLYVRIGSKVTKGGIESEVVFQRVMLKYEGMSCSCLLFTKMGPYGYQF